MIRWLSCFCLFIFSVEALCFKEILSKGSVGDFIVSEQKNMRSLLRVHTLENTRVILEEITYPKKLKIDSWEKWLKDQSPGHTSWTLLEIDLQTNELLECFSITRQAWLLPESEDLFFLKLLTLPFSHIPEDMRRRVGPITPGKLDKRKVWNPPLIKEGEKISDPEFTVYRVKWPSDNSLLSDKTLDLYFDTKNEKFPFPYWARISQNSLGSFKLQIIDSGHQLTSPQKQMPRRPLSILQEPKYTDKGIVFQIQCPKYYKDFSLFAAKNQDFTVTLSQIPYDQEIIKEQCTIFIPKEHLKKQLEAEKEYSFILFSDYPFSTKIETKPLQIKQWEE